MQKTNIKQRPADEKGPLNARLAEDQENDEVNDVDKDADLAGDEEEELDDTPELDEEDLEENNLLEEDADKVQWDPQKDTNK
ncbi:hypothetical protein [Chitinophaga ginsengisoli]|uniref:Uncharacterized protein n=1 Tax=Chitinophaga ginsengisoli TaxID=363837 RepID=A0A2P8GLG8_9BACT|nr:hypothetical protein [Chitinophaga ginsengisoli]PSL34813.1 hypothetical protein CLV42_102386 [Chitinophaga ginsengisoli]